MGLPAAAVGLMLWEDRRGRKAAKLRDKRRAAEHGEPDAQFDCGNMYSEGKLVPQDDAEAANWWQLAADQGHTKAQYNLGTFYLEGRGVPKDLVQAHLWLNLAATIGVEEEVRSWGRWRREDAEGEMKPEQICEAEDLASEWLRKGLEAGLAAIEKQQSKRAKRAEELKG